MGLKEEVLRGIYGYGFNKPSPIQMKGVLPVIQGNDTIAQVSLNFLLFKKHNQINQVGSSINRIYFKNRLNQELVRQEHLQFRHSN